MRVYPEKLATHLQQQLLPVYLISGDEPLLVQECADLVRQQARAQGCGEREGDGEPDEAAQEVALVRRGGRGRDRRLPG